MDECKTRTYNGWIVEAKRSEMKRANERSERDEMKKKLTKQKKRGKRIKRTTKL